MNESYISSAKLQLGRKSLYLERYCEDLITHCAKGLTFDSFGATINVTTKTLYEWCKRYEDFSDARDIARSKNRLYYESKVADSASGLSEVNPSAAMWMLERIHRKPVEDGGDCYGREPSVNLNMHNDNSTRSLNVIDVVTLSLEAKKMLAKELIKRELSDGRE